MKLCRLPEQLSESSWLCYPDSLEMILDAQISQRTTYFFAKGAISQVNHTVQAQM